MMDFWDLAIYKSYTDRVTAFLLILIPSLTILTFAAAIITCIGFISEGEPMILAYGAAVCFIIWLCGRLALIFLRVRVLG